MVGIRLFPFGMTYFQVRTVSVRECSVDEKGTVFSKWSEITLVFQSYLLEDRCFVSQIPSEVRLLEGPLTSAHQVFGEFWKTRDITLPKSNSKFAPENRPFDTKLEISSNPTIHFQGRLLRATTIIPLIIAALLRPYGLFLHWEGTLKPTMISWQKTSPFWSTPARLFAKRNAVPMKEISCWWRFPGRGTRVLKQHLRSLQMK